MSYELYNYFSIAHCKKLTVPENGEIYCNLQNDEIPLPTDTCSFTCNFGYELTGSDTRMCQNDRSWNGSNPVCNRGEYTIVT